MINQIKAKLHALRKERDKCETYGILWHAHNDDIEEEREKAYILSNAGSERLWRETAAESLAFRHVGLDTLDRWLRLDLPADVLAEIEQEINTRKE